MELFKVYDLFDIDLKSASHCQVYDGNGIAYLDFYGGHAVISIGHNHPYFVQQLDKQLREIIFYSNSVINGKQEKLARRLSQVSGVKDHRLFLCNSGAEANENALKLASFHNARTKVIALKNGFHGRTSAAVNVTDNAKIQAPINRTFEVSFCQINDSKSIVKEIMKGDACAVILEVIQGIGGLHVCNAEFLQSIQKACLKTDTILIADEVQAGFGRSGRFFAFQHAGIEPDIITMAKGMGNGIPVAGLLISNQKFEGETGLLGSTFGGNYLACTAALSVLDVIVAENLLNNVQKMSTMLRTELKKIPQIKKIRGMGLMLGCAFEHPVGDMRKNLLFNHQVFTGSSKDPNLLRLLPPLSIGEREVLTFANRLKSALENV